MKIAIQGEAGSFSHEAARRMAPGCTIVPCARSAEVFDRVGRGSVDAAVIPIENSLAGSVTEHFDLLLARKVFIEREFRLRVVHNLIALPGVKRADIRRALFDGRGLLWGELGLALLGCVVGGAAVLVFLTRMLSTFRTRGYISRYT